MDRVDGHSFGRRGFLAGSAAGGLVLLTGCEGMGGFSMVEAIRRLLTISAQRAFSRLTAPGGFWDNEVARFDLPDMFSGSGGTIRSLLTSTVFKSQLQKQLNLMAEKGAERAAPVVLEAVRNISITDAVRLVRGGPNEATTWLRGEMGPALVNAMVPGLSDALRISRDPIVGQAIRALSGVDVSAIAGGIATRADNSIWSQIGVEESAIRANPQSTSDPLLIGVFRVL
ncbi:MAG: DUF4197 domain-containing protein [Novosphingobium sp.]